VKLFQVFSQMEYLEEQIKYFF